MVQVCRSIQERVNGAMHGRKHSRQQEVLLLSMRVEAMRLRCARCGCYVQKGASEERYISGPTYGSGMYEVTWRVQPCKRCLHDAAVLAVEECRANY